MLPLLAAMLAAPPPPNGALVPIIREVGKVCAGGAPIRDEASLAFVLVILDPPKGAHFAGCRSDPDLAIRAARALAEAPSGASAAATRFLGDASAEGRGVPRDAALAESWYLRAYALDALPFIPPSIPQARRDAFLASDEAIAMLRDRLRRGSPEREQLRLAAALALRHSPGDMDEAARLAVRSDSVEAQTLRLQIARALLAGAPDADRETMAATLLKGAASSLPSGSESRALLLALGRKRLGAARSSAERVAAIDLLGAAAIAGEPEPLDALQAAVRRENGGSDPVEVEAPTAMKLVLHSEDYPSYALRQGLEGVVSLRALVDPRGRIVALVPRTADQPPPLVEALRRIYAGRGPAALDGPARRPTPWLWMKLPSVTFRIAG